VSRLPLPGADPLVRLLILPPDPEAERLALDDSFWEWFTGDLPDPGSGRPARWGSRHQPTSRTALRYQPYGSDECRRYLAVHRSGALEMGLGHDAGSGAKPATDPGCEQQVADLRARGALRLITTVGRIWAAVAAYAELLERWPVDGPFQVVLGVRQTQAWSSVTSARAGLNRAVRSQKSGLFALSPAYFGWWSVASGPFTMISKRSPSTLARGLRTRSDRGIAGISRAQDLSRTSSIAGGTAGEGHAREPAHSMWHGCAVATQDVGLIQVLVHWERTESAHSGRLKLGTDKGVVHEQG